MLRENSKIVHNIHRAWDVCLTLAAFIAAYFIKRDFLPDPWVGLSRASNYYALLLLCIIIWYLVLDYSGVYRPYRRRAFVRIALNVVRSVFICVMLMLAVLFVIREHSISRIFIGIFVLLDVALLVGSKWVLYSILWRLREKGYNFRNVLIVGCGSNAMQVARSIKDKQGTGFRVIGCLSVEASANNRVEADAGVPLIGKIEDLQDILTGQVVDELVFAEPLRNIPQAGEFINEAAQMGISVHLMPDWEFRSIGFKPQLGSLQVEDAFGLITLSLSTAPDHRPSIVLKNLIDVTASGLALAVCLLPFILIALAIKLSSPGPVFYRQERVGQNGRRFTLYKFRTMIEGADKMQAELLDRNESDGPVFKMRHDPRVVPRVGNFLRKTSLDELPQLINIFNGHMSLVGPRPPLPEEIEKYGRKQRRRLSMKPGLTCLWQISPRRNDLSFEEWVRMDLDYIDTWSLWLDFKILLQTVKVVLTGQGR